MQLRSNWQGSFIDQKKNQFYKLHTLGKRKLHLLNGKSQTTRFITTFYDSASCMSKEYWMIQEIKGRTKEIHVQKMPDRRSWKEKSSLMLRAPVGIREFQRHCHFSSINQTKFSRCYPNSLEYSLIAMCACEYIYTCIQPFAMNKYIGPPKSLLR